MNFYETKHDIKRTTHANVSKNSNMKPENVTLKDNIEFGIKHASSVQFLKFPEETRRERYQVKYSKKKFSSPSEVEQVQQFPLSRYRTKTTEVIIGDNKSSIEKNGINVHEKEDIFNYIDSSLEKYLSQLEKKDNNCTQSKEDLTFFIENLVNTRIEYYSSLGNVVDRSALQKMIITHLTECFATKADVSEMVQEFATKADVSEMVQEFATIDNVSELIQDFATFDNVSELVQVFVSKSEVFDIVKDFPTKSNVTDLIQEFPTKANITEWVQEFASKSEVLDIVKDFPTKAELVQDFPTKTNVSEMVQDFATKADVSEMVQDFASKAEVSKMVQEFASKAEVSEMVQDFATKTAVSEMAHDFATKETVSEMVKDFATKADVSDIIDTKIEGLSMKQIVDKYLKEIINMGEDTENENNEEAKTKFEEIIEPAVARIIYRVMKYDQVDDTENMNVPINLDVDYGEVYHSGLEQQENVKQQTEEELHSNGNKSCYNPMYSNEPTQHEETELVEMGSVYKKDDESYMFQNNELRTKDFKNRRWSNFGNGVEIGSVIDIFLDNKNKKIYIAGHFKHVNRIPIENIAVYDLTLKQWKHVGEGIPNVATSIAVDDENEVVYVGGVFSSVGKGESKIKANNIACFHVRENKWYALGEGLNRDCTSIIYDAFDKKIYAAGSFTESGSKSMKYVGIYDIDRKEWNPLDGGSINGPCRVMLKNKNDLYLGGLFTHVEDQEHVSYVAKYNIINKVWTGFSGGVQGYCNAIAYDSGANVLYVGGTFTNAGGTMNSIVTVNHIGKYNMTTEEWSEMDGGLNNVVHSIYIDEPRACLYVGGTFTHTFDSDVCLNHIAKFDINLQKWKPLENTFNAIAEPQQSVGLNGLCKMISMDKKSLFIAGSFKGAGNITANSIVRYALER